MDEELDTLVDWAAAGIVAVGAAGLTMNVLDWQSRIREERAKKEAEKDECPGCVR